MLLGLLIAFEYEQAGKPPDKNVKLDSMDQVSQPGSVVPQSELAATDSRLASFSCRKFLVGWHWECSDIDLHWLCGVDMESRNNKLAVPGARPVHLETPALSQ